MQDVTCPVCRGAVPARHGRGRPAKYCSDACRREAKRESDRRYEARRKLVRPTGGRTKNVPCAGCGKLLWGGRGSLPPGERMCNQCRTIHHPALRPRQTQIPISYANCRDCGELFVRHPRRQTFCSSVCRWRFKSSQRRHAIRVTTDIEAEPISITALAERDGWTCHICGKPTSRTRGNKRESPSVDHLVPLSCGGTHTWGNVALAHRHCNAVRGIGGTVQLRLGV